MFRSLLIAFMGDAFLVAPAMLPSAFVAALAPGLSGSAYAALNLNTSRSNIYRTKKTSSSTQRRSRVQRNFWPPHRGGDHGGFRGGGGGGGARMGGGGGHRK